MIVLDTHVLVWWVSNPEHLSKRARERIEKEAKTGEILVSSISVWEIYMLIKKGRLTLTMEVNAWFSKVEDIPSLRFVPIDNTIAKTSVGLPQPLHGDPADRIIIATALAISAPLITSDKRILKYPHVQLLW